MLPQGRNLCAEKKQNILNLNNMENGRMMVLHSLLIGLGIYLFMIFVLKQNPDVAENRSILIAAILLIYMIVFGHGLPTSMNKKL